MRTCSLVQVLIGSCLSVGVPNENRSNTQGQFEEGVLCKGMDPKHQGVVRAPGQQQLGCPDVCEQSEAQKGVGSGMQKK
jgi:hypothetical protein